MSQSSIPSQIGKLLPLLASDRDGEVIATARAICRMLDAVNLDLHDLAAVIPSIAAAPPHCAAALPSFFDMSRACRDLDDGRLSSRERRFVQMMCRLGGRQPSPRQAAWLADLYTKLSARCA